MQKSLLNAIPQPMRATKTLTRNNNMAGLVSGLILVDKPAGWTSHDVVSRTRKIAGTRKVGHAGTLDPMATGMLVIGFNKATRLLTYIVDTTKTYRATIRLGHNTTTDDADGDIVQTRFANADTSDHNHDAIDRKSTRLNSSHVAISYAVFGWKEKDADA